MNVKELKERIAMEDVLHHYGIPSPGIRAFVCSCRLHPEQDTMSVDLDGKIWFCSRCDRGGDMIDFVRAVERCSFIEAVRILTRLAEVEFTDVDLSCCTGGTGRNNVEIFRPFTYKVRLTTEHPLLKKMELTGGTLAGFEAGFYPRCQGFLAGCLAVRLHDERGNAMGYAGQRVDEMERARYGTWKFPRALPEGMLYKWHRACFFHDQEPLIVTDSPWMVMKLYQLDHDNAVSLFDYRISDESIGLINMSDCAVGVMFKPARTEEMQYIAALIGPRASPVVLPYDGNTDCMPHDELAKYIG